MKKLNIKKGDTVYVNAGNDKGKTGKVLSVDPSKDRAIVEGINIVSKHTKPNSKQPQGGIVKQEAGIHVSIPSSCHALPYSIGNLSAILSSRMHSVVTPDQKSCCFQPDL